MRRSICYCEPSVALAGETNTWKFIYTTANKLPKGTKLKFDLMSQGRPIDWDIPSVSTRKSSNLIYGLLENGKTIAATEVEIPNRYTPQYEFTLPTTIEPGSDFTIVIGSPKITNSKTHETNGNQAQTCSQRRRSFLLFIDTSGKGRYAEPETFNMDVKGNQLHAIKLFTPSYVKRNKRFDVSVRFEDEHGNLTNNTPDETMIELSYENIRENLNWKLFVPETGFIILPNLYFNDDGFYTLQLRNNLNNEVFKASPIRCFPEDSAPQVFWGLLHGESERYDSTENIESCLRHFRDETCYNYVALSPFESAEETSNDMWKLMTQNAIEFDESDRFTTFIGCQWVGKAGEEGMRHFLWTKDTKQIMRKKEIKFSSLKKIYASCNPKELIGIPTFTMGKGTHFNFKNFDPEFEPVVEIYNAWGSSECTKKEGNTLPITGPAKKGINEATEGSIQAALNSNHRFGFVAGGLDDRGIYAPLYDNDQEQYHPGLTAVIAEDSSRTGIADALRKRACFATTGERMLIGLSIIGQPMGSELKTTEKHGLLVNRHIEIYVGGTEKLTKVELIRNGKVLKTFETDGPYLDAIYDDMEPLEKVAFPAKGEKPPFIYYYLRATQEDDHMIWSSPIWVDFDGVKKLEPKKAKPKKVLDIIEEEDDDDDIEV